MISALVNAEIEGLSGPKGKEMRFRPVDKDVVRENGSGYFSSLEKSLSRPSRSYAVTTK